MKELKLEEKVYLATKRWHVFKNHLEFGDSSEKNDICVSINIIKNNFLHFKELFEEIEKEIF